MNLCNFVLKKVRIPARLYGFVKLSNEEFAGKVGHILPKPGCFCDASNFDFYSIPRKSGSANGDFVKLGKDCSEKGTGNRLENHSMS